MTFAEKATERQEPLLSLLKADLEKGLLWFQAVSKCDRTGQKVTRGGRRYIGTRQPSCRWDPGGSRSDRDRNWVSSRQRGVCFARNCSTAAFAAA